MRSKIRTSVSDVVVPKTLSKSIYYKLGAIVRKKLEEVEKLKTGGQFNVVIQNDHDPVEKIPIGVAVSLYYTLQNVQICIEDKTLGIIGLYGIRCIGKTNLPYKINNEFLNVSHDFDEVILVSVSKQLALEMVQKKIMDKLDLSRDIGSPDSEQTNAQRILARPLPNDRNQSKVVFAT